MAMSYPLIFETEKKRLSRLNDAALAGVEICCSERNKNTYTVNALSDSTINEYSNCVDIISLFAYTVYDYDFNDSTINQYSDCLEIILTKRYMNDNRFKCAFGKSNLTCMS